MSATQTVLHDQQLLHYRVLRLLGAGGMGTVYEAEDLRLGRPVAIKMLHPADAMDTEARERFLREARSVAAIEHRNLSTVYAIEETDAGTLFLVMPLYRGQTLADVLRQGSLSASRIASIGMQIAHGLHAAHMAGILHRDIKPANIFILHNDEVKILDFGLARLAGQSHLTRPNQVMGTLSYMSPEQLSGSHVDYRSDLWALGAVLYEMAANHPPFHHPVQATVISLIGRGDFMPLHAVRPDLPSQLHEAIHGALRVEAKERHSSAEEMARLLDVSVAASPIAIRRRAGADDTQEMVTISDTNTGTRPLPRLVASSSSWRAPKSGAGRTTIAVLPLGNLSANPENEYFSDGLTDELISALGSVAGLSVVSRASAFSFKGKSADVREIGVALRVETVLEGSVRRFGDKVRVSVQLIDAKTGFQMWTGKFDREVSDIFALQDEVADATVKAICEKLARPLSSAEHLHRKAPDPDAYDTYLKGRFHWHQKTVDGIQLAGHYFEEALKLDPAFADAHSGMADYYSVLGSLGMMPPHEAWLEARASAMHAIALDPDLPEAHLALASVLQFYDWNWSEGRQEIEKAIALRPSRGESYISFVYHLMTQGQLDEALAQCRKGLRHDPLSAGLLSAQSVLHTYLGRHDTSIMIAREALKSSTHYELYYALGLACHASGRTSEAIEALRTGLEQSRMPLLKGWLAEAHVKQGNRSAAEKFLEDLLFDAEKGSPSPMSIAVAATSLGNSQMALDWLEKAADARDILVGYIRVMPSLEPLRKMDRYRQLVRRMKLHAAEDGERLGVRA